MITIGSLFSGIGGLEMGLESCGLGPVVWQAESDPYARAVLAKHWPTVRRYADVREIDGTAERPDIICGGFPCQDISNAGKRVGIDGERSGLWSEFARIVRVLRPRFVFVENVAALANRGLDRVLGDLAEIGFDAEWDVLRAADVGAPHLRARLFLLAYADRIDERLQPGWRDGSRWSDSAVVVDDGAHGTVADACGSRLRPGQFDVCAGESNPDGGREAVSDAHRVWQPQPQGREQDQRQRAGYSGGGVGTWSIEPDVGRVANGVPHRSHRLRLLGNAVVPAQAALAWRSLTARTQEAA